MCTVHASESVGPMYQSKVFALRIFRLVHVVAVLVHAVHVVVISLGISLFQKERHLFKHKVHSRST
jgi:hypothetical protein